MRARLLTLLAALLLAGAAASSAGAADRELPLGPRHLDETRTTRWIAPGVMQTRDRPREARSA